LSGLFSWLTPVEAGHGKLAELGVLVQQRLLRWGIEGHHGTLFVCPGEKWCDRYVNTAEQALTPLVGKPFVRHSVQSNPSWLDVEAGVKLVREHDLGLVVGFGGGSALDAAKVITEHSRARFLVTIPTTAGTGGEISPWAVITNPDTRDKESVVAHTPDLALLDPDLTLTVPPAVTLWTGVDAFAHAFESYLSSAATAATDSVALAAVDLLAANLPLVMEDGRRPEPRAAMLHGSLLAGAAMITCGLGLVHAVANPLGGIRHELPHGMIIAQLLAPVAAFNAKACPERMARVKPALEAILDVCRAWTRRLTGEERPVTITYEERNLLLERVPRNVNAATNPRPFDTRDLSQLLYEAFGISDADRVVVDLAASDRRRAAAAGRAAARSALPAAPPRGEISAVAGGGHPEKLRLGLAQCRSRPYDIKGNLDRVRRFVRRAVGLGANLAVFPELMVSGYSIGENASGAALTVEELGAELGDLPIDALVGFAELPGPEEGPRPFNSAAYIRSAARPAGEPAVAAVQRKINLPTYGVFAEGDWFEPGPSLEVFRLAEPAEESAPQAAVLICADAWSQGLAYAAALKGAEILFHPAASPADGMGQALESRTSWQRLNETYARLLSSYVVFVNRVGEEGPLRFWGGSEVIDPRGRRLVRAPYWRESLRVVEIDLDLLRQQRELVPILRQERWDCIAKALETMRSPQA